MTSNQPSPTLTGGQNAYAAAANSAFGAALALVLVLPGAGLTCVVALGIWHLTRTHWMQRLALAVLAASAFSWLHGLLLLGWPWRLAGLGFASASQLGLNVQGVLRSLTAEATFGPTVALLVQLGFAMRQRTPIGQVQMTARNDRPRARALLPNYKPHAAPTDRDKNGSLFLGHDHNGQPFSLGIQEISQHIVLPGATGSGKTTTIVRLATGALANGYAVAIIDGKGGSLGGDAQRLANAAQAPFAIVHPDEPGGLGYDACTGDPADVANKLVGVFPFGGDSDIYKQVAIKRCQLSCAHSVPARSP